MSKVEIISPAGNLSSLKAAIDSGADTVYLGFNDATNARNFEGLNFTPGELEEGVDYVRSKGKRFYVAINTFPQMDTYKDWYKAVDEAARLKADAIIIANLGMLKYARETYPDQTLHLSVQASSSNYESINYYKRHFDISMVVLPRVVTIEEIRHISANTDVKIEVFALGGTCVNIEGRCYLSSFLTGASTNTEGACSPSRHVKFEHTSDGGMNISLNSVLLNKLSAEENSAYPVACKGRYIGPDGDISYVMEEPESLNVLGIIPELIEAGVDAFKIEGRQRTKSYVANMTRTLREAVDLYYRDPEGYSVSQSWQKETFKTFEGTKMTFGAYLSK